ncbi:MAG: SDR family oxidoreductase [Rhodospirillales bacterium]
MPEGGQIVVTGGSRGIGAAIVAQLAEAGRNVVSLSRSGAAPAGRALACDVTDGEALRQAFAEIAEAGPIRGFVANAGLHLNGPTADFTEADFAQVMSLNATAVFLGAQAAYPHLKAAGGGRIVTLGSFFDRLGVPHNLAYCASKAAVAAMVRCLGVEWAQDGITAVNLAPGYIETDLNRDWLAKPKVRAWLESRVPIGRPGRPEEVAELVTLLLAGKLGFLTGETIYLDGAQGINH